MTAEPTGLGLLDLPTPSQTEAGMWRAESWLSPPWAGPAESVYCMETGSPKAGPREREREKQEDK